MKLVWNGCRTLSQWLRWGGIVGTVGGIAIVGNSLGITVCFFRRWTGISCPTCGSTRASLALLSGHFHEGFYLNPLFTIALLCALIVLGIEVFCTLWLRRVPRILLSSTEKTLALVLLSLVILAHWLWMIL